jgi:phosphatidate cytidylyltransferase
MSSIAANGGSVRRADGFGLSQLNLRIVSALVLGPLAIACIYFGPPWFNVLIAMAVAIMAWEWTRMCCGPALTAESALAPLIVVAGLAAASFGHIWIATSAVIAGGICVGIIAFALRRDLPVWAGSGVLLVGLAGIGLVSLRSAGDSGVITVLWFFGAIWATDTFAYFAGKAIGGPRLAPRISPNKTWAGLLGGVIASAAFSAAWLGWLQAQGILHAILLGVAVAVVAQLSDLMVSRVKRLAHVKDTGTLIPGHGGLLDRADGFLLNGTLIVLLALLGGKDVIPWQ